MLEKTVLVKTVLVKTESLGAEEPDGPEDTEDRAGVKVKSPLRGLSLTDARLNDLASAECYVMRCVLVNWT